MTEAALDPTELTVLVVDDERENLEAFSRALRGYQILATDNGEQALVMLAERRVDLVVADQRMPGTRGAQLLQRARAINPLIRRIIVSASSQPEHILEAINSGEVERYLLKPIAPQALRDTVDQLARQYLDIQLQQRRLLELQDQLHALKSALRGPQVEGMERLELELSRARRYHRDITFLRVPNGEALIEQLRDGLREVDIVVRVGSELIVALPETDRAGAQSIVNRMKPALAPMSYFLGTFPTDGSDLTTLLSTRPG